MIYCVKKLHFYGLRGVAQEWIQSYLENRKQFVSFNNCHSEILNVLCGVPQGSILGPKIIYHVYPPPPPVLMTSVKSHNCSSIFYLLMIQIYYVVIET